MALSIFANGIVSFSWVKFVGVEGIGYLSEVICTAWRNCREICCRMAPLFIN